ncbi:MAG: dTMP kinase [Solirubrobacteraceae bacterium]|nr:dTMP kinase [Solirubrobacteraceae bacterium]
MRGRLISVEGLDGTGKTTVCAALAARLEDAGVRVLRLREPGGTAVGEQIRGLLADPSRTLEPRTELLLFAAARAELVDTVVRPALDEGTWVLLDRFVDSTLAYQGAGRELGDDTAGAANAIATGGLLPDRTLLLLAPAAVRAGRMDHRGEAADRLEQAGEAMFARTEARYEQLLTEAPERVRAVDASGEPDDVVRLAWDATADLLEAAATSG